MNMQGAVLGCALINGSVWIVLSMVLVPLNWAVALGLFAFIATLPLMAAVMMAADHPVVGEPVVRGTLYHHTHAAHETGDVSAR